MSGLKGPVVDQVPKLRSVPLRHQYQPRSLTAAQTAIPAAVSSGVTLFPAEDCPGRPCCLVRKRQQRLVEPAPLDHSLQPSRTAIVTVGEPAENRTGAVDHLPAQIIVRAPPYSAQSGRPGARSFDLLKEPAWALPRQRTAPACFRGRGARLHGGGPCKRR